MRHAGSNRTRVVLLAALATLLIGATTVSLAAAPASGIDGLYSQAWTGDGNLPPGCIKDMSRDNPDNICHHAKVGLNALDSPQVDVAVLVPVSPAAERDMRIMRQAVEAWEAGLDYLAPQMDMQWLADGVDFHITLDVIDLTGGEGGEFTTYPLYDPEIVVIATNPAGGAGIGIDPVDFTAQIGNILEIYDDEDVPCHGIPNPFDIEYWEALPGFDSHHEYRGGTHVEDCGGAGGNVCFSVNGGVDAFPGETDMFSLFDLVLHETGHCLTLGHVGDGADGAWGQVPTNDIMAYSYDPPGLNKCVSTLNVEAFALRMSRYLDVDGNGEVTDADLLEPNDVEGDGLNSFQVQHPDDHLYASSTGSAWDCPQADLGLVPGDRTVWTPEPVPAVERAFEVASPVDGAVVLDGAVRVTGTAAEGPVGGLPTATTATTADPVGDAYTPFGDIEQVDVEATDSEVIATLKVGQLLPEALPTSVAAYSISIGYRQIDSFVDPQNPGVVTTYDHSLEAPLPTGWSEWDTDAGTVTFRIPRSFLADGGELAPYDVVAWTNIEANYKWYVLTDDRAPDEGRLRIAAPPAVEGQTYELPEDTSVDLLDLLLGELEQPQPSDAKPTPDEEVHLYVDGALARSVELETGPLADKFDMDVTVPAGRHELTIEWEKRGRVLASVERTVVNPIGGAPAVPLPATGGGAGAAVAGAMLLFAVLSATFHRQRRALPRG